MLHFYNLNLIVFQVWKNIKDHTKGLIESNNAGMERARWADDYAFLIEGNESSVST